MEASVNLENVEINTLQVAFLQSVHVCILSIYIHKAKSLVFIL